jgi:hypothetical protein
MPDLGDDLRASIEGAAAPVTLDELADRTAAGRRRRGANWRPFAVATVAVVLVLALVVAVVQLGGDDTDHRSKPHIAAPTVAVGDIDLAVLSTSFDGDGARGPIDASVLDAVRAVPGVAGAQGAMQRFVDVVRTDATFQTQPPASERSAVAISWEEGAPLSFSAGGPPRQASEVAINQVVADRYQVGVGDDLLLRTGSMSGAAPGYVGADGQPHVSPLSGSTVRVAGVFTLPGGDVADLNLVVLRSDDLATITGRPQFDRLDLVTADHVPIDEVIDRVAAALPDGTMVVPPSVVGFDEQLRAELEIQRAYHWVLSPDHERARGAALAPATGEGAEINQQSYDQNVSSIRDTEFRVSRVTFLDSVTALVTVRLYFGGMAWSGVPEPTTAVTEKVDGAWRVSQMCEYARAGGARCVPGDAPSAASFSPPPNGWNAVDSVPGLADAYRVVADPASSVDQRVATIDRGDQLRDAIARGVKADAAYAGNVTFTVSGARLLDPTHAQLLYSVIADGGPHLETPYPFVGNAVLVDGQWKVASRYACGLTALATLSCPAAAALPTPSTRPSPSTISTTSTTRPASTSVAPTSNPPATSAPTTDPDAVEVPTSRAGS